MAINTNLQFQYFPRTLQQGGTDDFAPTLAGNTGTFAGFSFGGMSILLGGGSNWHSSRNYAAPQMDPVLDGTVGTFTGSISGSTYAGVTYYVTSAPVVPVPVLIPTQGGGLKYYFNCPNMWDYCLEDMAQVESRGLCNIHVKRDKDRTETKDNCYRDIYEPWSVIPKEGKEWRVSTTTLMPSVAGDYQLLTTNAPIGYDLVIWGIGQNLAAGGGGTGWLNGSGDLLWHIRRDRHWIKNLVNMSTVLGSYEYPWVLDAPVLVPPNAKLDYWLTVTANALGNINPASLITVTLLGWQWPEGKLDQDYRELVR